MIDYQLHLLPLALVARVQQLKLSKLSELWYVSPAVVVAARQVVAEQVAVQRRIW